MLENTGIKIIKNNFTQSNLNKKMETKSKTVHTFCEHCNSELEFTKDDTHIGWLGAAYVTCPCCGEESMVDELDGITLTKDNIGFPVHFLRFNKDMRHVEEVGNEEIIKEIRKGVEYFRKNKDEYCWYTSYGDLFVILFRYADDEEYLVVVTKDFYEGYIPFEGEDY